MSSLGPLDLSGADTSTFDVIPPGRYNATVFEVEERAASGEGKTPEGTPMINFQFRLSDEPYENRRVWRTLTIPPADHDADKAAKMKGMIVNTLLAIGYDEKTITNGKFKMDFEDMAGRECVVVLGKREWPEGSGEYTNDVKGVKPSGSPVSSGSGDSGGIL